MKKNLIRVIYALGTREIRSFFLSRLCTLAGLISVSSVSFISASFVPFVAKVSFYLLNLCGKRSILKICVIRVIRGFF